MRRSPAAMALALLCAACSSAPQGPGEVAPDADQGRIETGPDGRCTGREVTPAIIETVTEQVMVSPAVLNPDGSVLRTATFQTVTRQQIVRERREVAFEAVCASSLTPDFIASLQRALKVRGGYDGAITGLYDRSTAQAVRTWQIGNGGPDSPVLSLATARDLGLAALSDTDLNG